MDRQRYLNDQNNANGSNPKSEDNDHGFVHLDEEVQQQEQDFKNSLLGFEDMAKDSIYPLMSNDPSIKKDFIVKINDGHLNQVFDAQNRKNVLKSIYIQDDYMTRMAKDSGKKKKDWSYPVVL